MIDWLEKRFPNPQSSKRSMSKALGLGLLVTVATVLSPSAARAASFSMDDRAVIGLFRGGGSLLGPFGGESSPSGIDSLASQITTAFPDHHLTVQVFDSYAGSIFDFQEVGSALGTEFINQFDDVGAIALIGYSAGGTSAIRTAASQSPLPIDLLVQIDSYEPLTGRDLEDEVLPVNVQTGINYYQRRNRYNFFGPGWDPVDLGGATDVSGSENINVEEVFSDRTITHRTIDDDPRLHARIVQDIATYVLPNITFPPLPTSGIKDLPILLNSAPPAVTLAEADAKPVPEPNLLLAIGILGGGLYLMKKQH